MRGFLMAFDPFDRRCFLATDITGKDLSQGVAAVGGFNMSP